MDAAVSSPVSPSPTLSNSVALDQILDLLTPNELLDLSRATGRNEELARQDDSLWPISLDALLVLGLVAFEVEHGSAFDEAANGSLANRTEYVSRYLQCHSGIFRSSRQVAARLLVLGETNHPALRTLLARRVPLSAMGLPSWMTRFSSFTTFFSPQSYGCLRIDSVKVRYMQDDRGVLSVPPPTNLKKMLPDTIHVSILNADVPSMVLLASPMLLSGHHQAEGMAHGTQPAPVVIPIKAEVELLGRGYMLRDRWCYLIDLMAAKDDLSLSREWLVTHVLYGHTEHQPGVRYAIELRYHVTNLYLHSETQTVSPSSMPRENVPPFDDGYELIKRYALQSGVLVPDIDLSGIRKEALSMMRPSIPLEKALHVPDRGSFLAPLSKRISTSSRAKFLGVFKLDDLTVTSMEQIPSVPAAEVPLVKTVSSDDQGEAIFVQESGRDKKRKRT
ncbi:hypothetical protein HMN09_00455500 [Mycena chlorophos]|uniref:Uncharacterized protein n=1 Tax=Mycena chlorophos TaxID=658473 RepID=A0A8H6WHP0_MYCCL|nr:hypothetical protein HMN09_00455500 [Mycena chlorophos]